MTKANEQERSAEKPRKINKLIAAIIVLIFIIGAGYIYVNLPAKSSSKTSIPVFSNVCIVVEPQLGQIRLPNVTNHKFQAELRAKDGDSFKVFDVAVEDRGAEREFVFNLTYDFDKGLTQIKTIKASVKYSELPQKYHQYGKWTVWVKREGAGVPNIDFITKTGEYIVSPDAKHKVRVYEDGDKLNYRICGASPLAPIEKDSGWFIYVESLEKYWIFDGDRNVMLLEFKKMPEGNSTKLSDLPGSNYKLLNVMPTAVKDKLPKELLNTIRKMQLETNSPPKGNNVVKNNKTKN